MKKLVILMTVLSCSESPPTAPQMTLPISGKRTKETPAIDVKSECLAFPAAICARYAECTQQEVSAAYVKQCLNDWKPVCVEVADLSDTFYRCLSDLKNADCGLVTEQPKDASPADWPTSCKPALLY